MFEGFAGVWTPIAMTAELGRDAPLGAVVAGTKVAVFRDASGAPRAVVDRCPHRGVELSRGKVVDGCLTCPFHGWQFDGTGAVTHVPWNPDAKLDRLGGAQPIPTCERGGMVWIHTSLGERAPDEPYVHEHFLNPDVRVTGEHVRWKTHWTRAMENMLDFPHLPFVHEKTIGRGMHGKRMDITWEERPWGGESRGTIDGQPPRGRLDWCWPNRMNLHIPIKEKIFLLQVACIPVSANETDMLLVTARGFMKLPLLDAFFHWQNRKIAKEDQAIVESSYPVVIPPASEEKSVRTDAFTLAFRKRYYAELHDSKVEPKERERALRVVSG
jgi:phenylpropionate dioxygenase-like ring-hydroxylating dioxygenase large terminal subunit